MYLGDGVELWCYLHIYYNPLSLDEPVITYSADDGGRFGANAIRYGRH